MHRKGRPIQACEVCRKLHIKCEQDISRGCRNCEAIGVECKRSPSYQFRNQSAPQSAESIFALGQAPPILQYHDETPKLIRFYRGESRSSTQLARCDVGTSTPARSTSPQPVALGAAATSSQYSPALPLTSLPWSRSSPLANDGSPTSVRTDQTPTQATVVLQSLRDSEAELMRNYIENMAAWADAADSNRTFEIEVPKRAIEEAVLLHAVCTFSALHLDRHSEALEHQDKCLQLLIPALSGLESINDSILASVAILRQIEEMDEQDERFHFQGTTRILEVFSDFAHSGGLGEAAAWLCLRENLYVSMTQQIPIQMNLQSFELSTLLRNDDDTAWASRMVLLLAELLSVVFNKQISQDISTVGAKIEEWDRTKPLSFYPIRVSSRKLPEKPFPELWMLSTPHVVAIQYFHIAQIVLAVSGATASDEQSDVLHRYRRTERQVRHHLVRVLGLTQSNVKAQNAMFMARHCLFVWGGYLNNPNEQQAALSLLRSIEHRTRWDSHQLCERLQCQWADEDNGDYFS